MSQPATSAVPSSTSLLNKVAVITGSSAGIGASIAAHLGARGAKVVINYPWPSFKDEAEAVGKTLTTQWIAVEADMSTIDGPGKLISAAVDKFGTIDILVNNAARVIMCPFAQSTLEQWQTSIDTNARGVFLTTQAALPHLTPREVGGGSRIVNIISGAAREPEVNMTVYAASKAAIDAMTKCWAMELPAKYGCTVNSVAPGVISTPGARANIQGIEDIVKPIFEARTPLPGAWGYAEDVAWAVAFAAEDNSKWLNGACINVSGGMFRW
ncbi:short chain type dehydrogenase [Ilyonectria sp. MPI-CAGE-AT-0026]|nr:short chain type dehydrogenase [Ilyonectria sp. MPI-CAGE-AT-0026]